MTSLTQEQTLPAPRISYTASRTKVLQGVTTLSVVLFIVAMFMNLVYAGTEATQGDVQRIFYIHLGAFFGSFVLFSGAVVAGIQYLRTRQDRWDVLGLSTIEVGLGFSLANIVTGAIWARPIWNTYWTWDPRLTTVTIMWLTYAAYLMLRAGIEDPERRKRFASVYSIIAFTSVLLTVIIIRVRPDTIHPSFGPTVTEPDASGNFEMSAKIAQTLIFNIITFSIIAVVVAWHRIRLENRKQEIEARKMRLLMDS